MKSRVFYFLLLFTLFSGFPGNEVLSQVKGLEGRWLIVNAKQDAFEHRTIIMRRFRDSDKFKKLSICLNFKKETGYVLEERFWKVELSESQGPGAKSYGYNGKVLTWVWESKDKFKVFCGDAFREYRIHWFWGNFIFLKEMHSKTPTFSKPFKNNLSSR